MLVKTLNNSLDLKNLYIYYRVKQHIISYARSIAKTASEYRRASQLYETAIVSGVPGKELAIALFEFSQLLVNETYLSRITSSSSSSKLGSSLDSSSKISATTTVSPSSVQQQQHYHTLVKSGLNASYMFHLLLQSAHMGHPIAQAYLAATYATGTVCRILYSDLIIIIKLNI